MKGAIEMTMDKKQVNKEIIIETALRLIDEKQGIKEVTLRDIAKEIGCAHTNLYNYFGSLDEIFWESLSALLSRMMEYSSVGDSEEQQGENKIYLTIAKVIDFFMEHPGWYRFMWFDSLGGRPSQELARSIHRPGEGFVTLVKMANSDIDDEKAKQVANILHSYFHGEFCKWINNRGLVEGDKEGTKAMILSNVKTLYKLLIQ
jgi:AcrR family transcriptional regulator